MSYEPYESYEHCFVQNCFYFKLKRLPLRRAAGCCDMSTFCGCSCRCVAKQISRNRRNGSQDPGLWQTGFHHPWNARDLYSRSPLVALVHDFEAFWFLNRSASGFASHWHPRQRHVKPAWLHLRDCGLKHTEHFTAAFVWLWEAYEIWWNLYGMKLYSRQAEKGPGRICRTTSMFGNAL